MTTVLGIIGGSGVYDIDGLENPQWITVESPFGDASDDLLVGTLKAATLYRVRIQDGALVEQEKLVTDFGRIRDVAMGADGLVYIAIEHNENGSIWRLVPE